jgi:hypothetical protein
MATQQRTATVPTFVHQFYSVKHAESPRRFPDLPAFRSFVGYQVRLVNVLLSRAKGFEIDEAATVISFNPYFVSTDFDDLLALLAQLAALGIVDGRLTEEAARQIHELRFQFDKNEAYFRRRFR